MVTAAMDSHNGDACFLQTFNVSQPQFRIVVYGVLDQYPFRTEGLLTQRVRQFLHSYRVGARSGAYPQIVDVCPAGCLDMLRRRDLGGYGLAVSTLHFLQPIQRLFACTLKRARTRTRFPYARAKNKRQLTARLTKQASGK